MEYIAILKDGGLFIPNILTDLDDHHPSVFRVPLDIQALREQAENQSLLKEEHLDTELPKMLPKVNLGDFPIKAFDNIKDPVEWQKSLREEW